MRKFQKFAALLTLLCLLLTGCTVVIETAPETTAPAPAVTGDGLTMHFIDVGQADCTLIECGGETLLIDGGNRDDGQLVVTYLEEQGISQLDTVVCTHAHEDHVGGLPSVLAVYPTGQVYAPTRTYSSRVFDDFMHYVDQQGLEVILPAPGDAFTVGDAQVTVLGPVTSYPDPNDTSIVLRIEYGSTVAIFTGDMETAAENDMLDHWDNDELFRADLLKVGHHGSNTSTGYRFLNAVDPTYGVIPVGKDNDYGHPHDEPMSRLKQAEVALFRTDELGTILVQSDGNQLTFTWGNQNAAPSDVEPAEPMVFIGNKNSKKFHGPDCGSLPSEKNQVFFDTYEEALAAGYEPCGGCLG